MNRNIKKTIIAVLFSSIMATTFAQEIAMRIMPSYNICSYKNFGNVFSGTASVDFIPIHVRKTDSINLSLQGSIINLNPPHFNSFNFYDVSLAAGYDFRVIDRLSINVEGNGGLWSTDGLPGVIDDPFSGISFGGNIGANFYLAPSLSIGAVAGYKGFMLSSDQIINNVTLGVSLKYNLTKSLFSSSKIQHKAEADRFDNLFPVFFSHYDDHSFGEMTFINNETTAIHDVEVSIFFSEFMSNPNVCGKFDTVKMGEEFSVELTAFLNEAILNNSSVQDKDALITIKYTSLGKKMEYSQIIKLKTLLKNNMNWSDDRHAAAFISPTDATASAFAKQVKSIVKSSLKQNENLNSQYAKALFIALKQYGIRYVKDPSSSFIDNVGTANIDYLQFPYQTLLYHGGDCDDLSILNCSMLQSIGIETALVTIPGHIFIAFDSGLDPETANASEYVIQDGKAWIPLEITLCQDTYALELKTGMNEWNHHPDSRALIPVSDAWKEFPAVGITDSDVSIKSIDKVQLLKEFLK